MAEESMKLQVLKCPSCGKPITRLSSLKSTMSCPRCGNIIKNPMATAKAFVRPERIIPFTTDEQTFENALVNSLINQEYCDKNIFSAINTDKVFKAYLPMYLYEGTFNASWSCESAYMDQKVKVSSSSVSTKDVKKWRPQNGNAAGNFSFLCLANETEDDLPVELRNFTMQFPYDVMMSKEYDDILLPDDPKMITVERNADATLVWQKHGKDLVNETAENAARQQIGNQEIRNFRATSSWNLTTTGVYVLVPFWFVYYTFNNQQYHFLMDGIGERTSYSYPIDQEDVAFVNGKEKIKKYSTWLWVLALLLWYVFNFTTAFVYLVIWLIGKIVVNKMMDKQIQEQLENSKAQRQAGANRI